MLFFPQLKCAQYWPQKEEKEMVFDDTNLKLTLISEDVKSYYTVRQLELENLAVSMACANSSRKCCLAFVRSPRVQVPAVASPGIVSSVHSVAPHRGRQAGLTAVGASAQVPVKDRTRAPPQRFLTSPHSSEGNCFLRVVCSLCLWDWRAEGCLQER